MAKAVDIVVYYTHGCPATPRTVELIRKCVSELKIRAALREVPVTTQEEADAWRFLGSPTVQVDGRDIEAAVRASKSYGFMWRAYGASAMPSREMILDALKEASESAGRPPGGL